MKPILNCPWVIWNVRKPVGIQSFAQLHDIKHRMCAYYFRCHGRENVLSEKWQGWLCLCHKWMISWTKYVPEWSWYYYYCLTLTALSSLANANACERVSTRPKWSRRQAGVQFLGRGQVATPHRRSGERCKLPQRSLGRSPSRNCGFLEVNFGIWWRHFSDIRENLMNKFDAFYWNFASADICFDDFFCLIRAKTLFCIFFATNVWDHKRRAWEHEMKPECMMSLGPKCIRLDRSALNIVSFRCVSFLWMTFDSVRDMACWFTWSTFNCDGVNFF